MTAAGTLIAESLRRDHPLECMVLRVGKITRADVGDTTAGQPLTWTLIEFEIDEGALDDLAAALSRSLEPSGGWYCDFRTGDETFVVFGGRIFRYRRGDEESRAEAEAYGRSVGVPDAQLDWPA